ncbi:Structural maintenance of chromosomes protein 2-2 [Camellia lanceoleosa]|uniref:Structural maintenance of chromosomes protein 2-2 n=1 Tax=Camellia lanceoleosa TaxID=1840588 RepID=A0ACC0GXG5_9ERIC|nr:Structural maintenance of chromosomes protein 2-2 [Camellia lanceoleosa]
MRMEIQEMETKVSKLTAEKDESMGGEVKCMSEKVDVLSQDLVREVSVLKNQEETLNNEKENAEKIVRSIEELKKSIEEKAYAVKNAEDGAADLKKRLEQLDKSLEQHEKDYQGVLSGKSSGSEEKCLEDQLGDAKVAVGSAETELKQLKTKISHSEKELKEKAHQLLSKREEAVAIENELNARTKDVENVKLALESLLYEDGQMEALQKDRATELELVQKLKDEIRILSAQLANVDFTYHDPVKNFDRTRVKGVVAKLIKVKDGSTMTALEVGKGNAEVALSLVGYDQELKSAMEYVFGSTFVCKTIDAAREVAFNREIGTTSVTLEGDIFQPSGLLTGGSRKGGGDLLRQLHALAEAESKLSIHQKRLSEIEAEISELLPLHKKFKDLKAQLELKSYDLSLFQTRAEHNEHLEFCELVKRIEQERLEAKSAADEKQLLYEECITTVSLLKKSICENTNNRDVKLKDLEKKMGKAQVQSGHANEEERLLMEMEAVKQECASLESQSVSLKQQINSLTSEVDGHKTRIASIRNAHDQAQSKLNLFHSKMKECDTQISCILREQQELQHKISETNLERKKMENEVKRMEMEQKNCSLKVEKLIEKHAWITLEKHRFGRSGTDFDFASCDPHTARKDFEKLQAEQSGLKKQVNKKVMEMFEKSEDEYNHLISKKNVIENDKTKIKMVIEELDEKKKETLKVTWVKVNNDFGSIFSTLLPGTMAKLETPEGSTFLDGLEVCVAFGSVWKQSLSELSGGQRSLLALSLILALLLFKPAPLYILDEVDAALDLSHTQNIGRMIKNHFPHSQFIVVSLIEGMFNNANVLFRTKFVDGVSTVQRTVASKPNK